MRTPTRVEQATGRLQERTRLATANIVARMTGGLVGLEERLADPVEHQAFDQYSAHFHNWTSALSEVTALAEEWQTTVRAEAKRISELTRAIASRPGRTLDDDDRREALEAELATVRETPDVYAEAARTLKAEIDTLTSRYRTRAAPVRVANAQRYLLTFGKHAERSLSDKLEAVRDAVGAFLRLKREIETAHVTMGDRYHVEIQGLQVFTSHEIVPLASSEATVGRRR